MMLMMDDDVVVEKAESVEKERSALAREDGYKRQGLVGINWASKTNALADENGLLDDVNTSFCLLYTSRCV